MAAQLPVSPTSPRWPRVENKPPGFWQETVPVWQPPCWEPPVRTGTDHTAHGEHSEQSHQCPKSHPTHGLDPLEKPPLARGCISLPTDSGRLRGNRVHPKPQLLPVLVAPGPGGCAGNSPGVATGPSSPVAGEPYKGAGGPGGCAEHGAGGGNMKPLVLLTLLALLTLGLCRRAPDGSVSAADSPSSEAFISRRASAAVVRRPKRNYVYGSVYGAVRDPLEAKREVCELNPDCDELADHIGFQEAYRRFYGPV
ncbi:osteocalcin isoform X1 [Columba livia]|uniref:osteocalcin isoform X1 n=1 Tax=Columba livia TaxID=8932 RepID=UPI0031BB5AA5